MKNKHSLIVSISTIKDLDKIDEYTKYISIDITNPSYDVIEYFIKNGETYLYTDNSGYNYTCYEDFKNAENIINNIYANMPNNLNKIAIAKYIYVKLANLLSSDINADNTKNELFNLSLVSSISNIWKSITTGKTNNLTCAKIYCYLCKRLDIDASVTYNKQTNTYLTKIKIDNQVLLTDLFKDIPFIQSKMHTKHFGNYNNDEYLDKKIKYIKTRYNDDYLDKLLKNIDYTGTDFIKIILSKTEKVINIDNIKPTELSIIYQYFFDKYCPNYNIKINNLFLNEINKKHFIMISYNNIHYSYNYRQKKFIKINEKDIISNINNKKIGIYLNEDIPNISNYIECIN